MDQGNPYQQKYWTEMVQLKTHILYLDEYLVGSERVDRNINAFLAVVSNGSICSWVIWQKYQFVWAVIIAVSQFLNAVKTFLPYKKRLQVIPGLRRDLEEISLLAERRWYDVAEGKLSQEKVHQLQSDIKEKRSKTLHKHIGSNPLPEKRRYMEKAEREAALYFKNFYRVEDQNGK